MNETIIEGASAESEKPVQSDATVKFPPFPDPTVDDFDDDVSEEERKFYKTKFSDLNYIKTLKLHCSACDKHIGCSTRNETRMRVHPMLRTLVCDTCHTFYNSGEFEKGDDGSELYCRWCGQGGQVYCCSDCPHVFCAKCIKRNFGVSKIREIEYADDWKCFKCNPNCLWFLRATCWALLRFCDLRNRIILQTRDLDLKDKYQKYSSSDTSECCRSKGRRKEKSDGGGKKKESEALAKKVAANIISKIPPTIQVKKFASIPLEDSSSEKKTRKRSASPKPKPVIMKNPIPITNSPKPVSPTVQPPIKKIRMPGQPIISNILNKPVTYTRIRPKIHVMPQMPIPIISNNFNGYNTPPLYNSMNNIVQGDNINLSLESLTQGLDMSAMAGLPNSARNNDDVVCTPDFPLEPLCEVTEDNDDDVQCITPVPTLKPQLNPPPLLPFGGATLPDLTSENIVQMTDNDVTVNTLTGGLKFRVDPQTLSSNKMYRLPDGRIFAINANPSMPGGYSATIVAVTEAAGKHAPRGATYAAKLSAVTTLNASTPTSTKKRKSAVKQVRQSNSKRSEHKSAKIASGTETPRECDLKVPVEWYRYNLIDAVDAIEYSLSRLNKLKKETTSMFLRTRTVGEMKALHKTLDRLLNTSSTRFKEIKENLNKGLKQYLAKKSGDDLSEDDDDVEILPNLEENDDPIFIDENSIDSSANDNQEVDLTGAASSELNDSGENRNDIFAKDDVDPLNITDRDTVEMSRTEHDSHFDSLENNVSCIKDDDHDEQNHSEENLPNNERSEPNGEEISQNNDEVDNANDSSKSSNDMNGVIEGTGIKKEDNTDSNKVIENDNNVIRQSQDIKEITENSDSNEDHHKKNDSNKDTEVKKENINDNENSKVVNKNETHENIAQSNDKDKTVGNDILNDLVESQDGDEKLQDGEMSEEMIETLLKDDIGSDDTSNLSCVKISHVTGN